MESRAGDTAEESRLKKLGQIAFSCLKLGTIGFGGIAGMVATLEQELVIRRQWINHQQLMDVLSASYVIPGPNAVEVVMHCGHERGGRWGLVVAGICYIVPAMLLCLLLGYVYQRYRSLPDVDAFLFGLRPATTALVIGTVFRLWKTTLQGNGRLILLCLLTFLGALSGLNEVGLIVGAGLINLLFRTKDRLLTFSGWLVLPFLLELPSRFSETKLFLIFLKIGAILYGSGYVLYAYMDESLVRNNHWLTHQQLMDAIAVGQLTPGPILSSATFAGYLIGGFSGGVTATVGIFLPSFFIYRSPKKQAIALFSGWVKCRVPGHHCGGGRSFSEFFGAILARRCHPGGMFGVNAV
ncbi:chromate transporter, chromate ion transporter (CHR) family [Spirosoma linguale DSM 74]|uniref:Chromate transporter, chromate ion transporter (CHR) family n=1 Tax=Spirosoma linguale (strain ATCC 33905 / DSM 74 / LMG 10896 / Claus 1) TaxID=504472 RepID=D2QC35_SPILD|nr:chromate transporter, chromate ion transporter (CHR) family [Spirosoma linguale DSM 74]